jgi:hypothetical protein
LARAHFASPYIDRDPFAEYAGHRACQRPPRISSQNKKLDSVLRIAGREEDVEDSSNPLINWSETFTAIEASVVTGQHEQARQLLNALNPKLIPREWAPRIAQLANRVHFALYALKVLYRFIAPENPLHSVPATDQEKMIYAYALCLLGAVDEALQIFSDIDTELLPEAAFLKALTYFRHWNYAASVPLLKEYLASENLLPYRRLLGEINLVLALVFNNQFAEALERAPALETACREGQYRLLLGNCHELKAQAHFFLRNYDQALSDLDVAERLLQGQQGLYSLFVEKWKCLSALFKKPSPESLAAVKAVQKKALTLDDHETVRECELFCAVATEDQNLLRKVIMGTPSEFYRHRARMLFGKPFRQLGQFVWIIGESPSAEVPSLQNGEPPFDFNPYEKRGGEAALYNSPQLLALFDALSTDFYRPVHLGGLFKQIYPEEKFNPYSSPGRILQLLKRLDQWFTKHQIPLLVEFKKSEFRLNARRSVRISIQRGKKLSPPADRWQEVRAAFSGRAFSTAQVAALLNVSNSVAQRLVKRGIADDILAASGRGRGVKYRFKTSTARAIPGKKAA